MREALEGRPERQRTRRDYDRVIEAYRAIYHGDPASSKADASVSAVADMLAEEGRIFQDEKALHDAIAQYEFLRKQYPGSRYRFSALLTEGEIYLRDLNDRESARATFQEFLKLYPQNPLANEARIELTNLRKAPAKSPRSGTVVAQAPAETSGTGASTATAKHSSGSQNGSGGCASVSRSECRRRRHGLLRKPLPHLPPNRRRQRKPVNLQSGRTSSLRRATFRLPRNGRSRQRLRI